MAFLRRSAESLVRRALRGFRAVFIGGPRQSGKTTLAQLGGRGRTFVCLDDLPTLSAARTDPQGFVAGLRLPVTIDEIQRAPDLLLPIKRHVDRRATPGAFLLIGSADPQAVGRIRETLAGRIAMIPLRPLTWAERERRPLWNPVSALLSVRKMPDLHSAFRASSHPRTSLAEEVLLGGFPEPVLRLTGVARREWHEQFARVYLERDVPLFVRPDDVAAFFGFVRLVAGSTAGILNLANLARDAGLSHDTARRWLSVLESTFVAETLPPYWRNVRKRLTKSPKIHFADTGLAAALLGLDSWTTAKSVNLAGPLTESWIHHHLRAFYASAPSRPSLHFLHTRTGEECDFVARIEAPDPHRGEVDGDSRTEGCRRAPDVPRSLSEGSAVRHPPLSRQRACAPGRARSRRPHERVPRGLVLPHA